MLLKRFVVPLAAVLLVLSGNWWTGSSARETWISVQSKHLLVIGNGSEKEIRQVALRLEQFRSAASGILTAPEWTEKVPTTVIVFKNDESYRPFKVNENNAGYFQPGQDVNYITLSTEVRGEQDPYNIIFHEYTHLLVNNSIGPAPAWFNEGLAEYYSTLSFDNRRVVVGRPIQRHITLLKKVPMLSLRTLFQVDYKSPYYNEGHKQSIFYAESWALMHFLMLNKNGQRAEQVRKFLQLIKERVPTEQAFQLTFETTFEGLQNELAQYIQNGSYPVNEIEVRRKLESDTTLKSSVLSEVDAQAYLGDLLLHSNRSEAEEYLQRALQVEPNHGLANAALGMLRVRQSKLDQAWVYLEKAIETGTSNHLIHYYYAYALTHTVDNDVKPGAAALSPDAAVKARRGVLKAISIRPDFPDSYNLLAFINLVTNTDIDVTIETLLRVGAKFPERIDFPYMLGQLFMFKDDYVKARPLLEKVVAGNVENRVKRHAEKLLATLTNIEQQRAQKEASRRSRSVSLGMTTTPDFTSSAPPDPSSELREVLRMPTAGERQVQGKLVSIECEPGGLVFVVKTDDKTLRLRTDTFQQVKRTTYTEDVRGSITCGVRKPENAVVVCYVPGVDGRSRVDGKLSSVEFVPSEFRLTP